jgi:predicted kinase
MSGLPGSGKSTLAVELGKRLGWPVIDKDTIKSGLLTLDVDEEKASVASYELLYDLARDLLVTQGLNVILDTVTGYPRAVEAPAAVARDAGGVLKVVYCAADPHTRQLRIAGRKSRLSQMGHPDRPAGEPDRLNSEGDGREHFPFLPPETLLIEMTAPIPELVEQLVPLITEEDE